MVVVKSSFFIPKQEAQKAQWLNNFATKIPTYAQSFGLSEADLKPVLDNNLTLSRVMSYLNSLRETQAKWVEYKDNLLATDSEAPTQPIKPESYLAVPKDAPLTVLPNVLALAVSIGESILRSFKCTADIARDLGLVPVAEQTWLTEPVSKPRPPRKVENKPRLRYEFEGDLLTLKIVRGEKFKGMMALVQECNNPAGLFTDLARTNAAEYKITLRFAPGERLKSLCFRVQMFDGEQAVGEVSDTLPIALERPAYLLDAAPSAAAA